MCPNRLLFSLFVHPVKFNDNAKPDSHPNNSFITVVTLDPVIIVVNGKIGYDDVITVGNGTKVLWYKSDVTDHVTELL